ncbi:helix-turn-helix domain-containing protein [Armatimonas sp.]|uniref:helix-turn-helix domain-containing protein n=1 Tax=Armatimonas sp. TaxID=1872638 RepID=UPI00286BB8B7|nr:helix-turn-helix domain-containing protein [Armatimonas sp.]
MSDTEWGTVREWGDGVEDDKTERDYLTVEQAASYLQLSQSSIRSYIRGGQLKAYRIAGKRKVLIQRGDLLALLEPARPTEP